MADIHQIHSRNAAEEAASRWIARLESDDVSDTDRAEFQAWLEADSLNREMFADMRRTWHRLDALAHYEPNWKEIRSRAESPTRRRSALVVSAAAAVLAALGVAAIWQAPQLNQNQYATTIGEQRSIELADGSVVQMNTNTTIDVRYTADRRTVALLKGEAHFDVEKDVTRPFVVIASGGLIRAVGTAFNVQVLEDANVEVTVTEGVVEVLSDASVGTANVGESGHGVAPTRITSNHKILYDPQRIATGNVAAVPVEKIERELAWRHGMLSFDGQSLDVVIKEVSRYTNVEFEFASDDLRKVQVGAYFKATDTDALLELLRSALDIESRRIGNTVLIFQSGTQSGDSRPAEVGSL